MFSISDYNIRKYKKINGHDGEGYEVDLYKGNTPVAYLKDDGWGGGPEIHLNRSLGTDDSAFAFLLSDMQQLLSHLAPVIKGEPLCYTFTKTIYSCAEGFVTYLLDLKPIIQMASKALKASQPDEYYIVGALGSSWFDGQLSGNGTTAFYVCSGTSDYETAHKRMVAYAEKQKAKHGPLIAGAILRGDMAWNLSLEDYASLYMP
jgi:hypothetical protein